jgi:glycine/betaine/sarcosine/D-proline reductase family selenoprotein B
LERAGIPTVCVTSLFSVAMRVGANRIFRLGKFHQPFGASDLTPDEEKNWRIRAVDEALKILKQQVTEPTVFQSGT